MKIIVFISEMIIPIVVFYIVASGVFAKVKVYDDFIDGAKDGMKTVVTIAPTLIGLMVGVGVLRASGFLDMLSGVIGRYSARICIPGELVPSVIVRMFSSSAATGMVLDIFKKFGTDSYIGSAASIMMASTETIFYTMSVYFMAAKVSKSRWTLPGALLSTGTGVAASLVLAGWLA